MANVWLVRETDQDLKGVEAFGTLSVVFPNTISPLDVASQHRIFREQVLPAAGRGDFILTAGPQVMVAAFVAAWVHEFGSVQFLVFDPRKRRYLPRRVQP